MIIISKSLKELRHKNRLSRKGLEIRLTKYIKTNERKIENYERNKSSPPLEFIEALCKEFPELNLKDFLFSKS